MLRKRSDLQSLRDSHKKYGQDILDIWVKYLFKRMSRENLVGKNMNSKIDIEKLITISI